MRSFDSSYYMSVCIPAATKNTKHKYLTHPGCSGVVQSIFDSLHEFTFFQEQYQRATLAAAVLEVVENKIVVLNKAPMEREILPFKRSILKFV